jgi:hypothetical protein
MKTGVRVTWADLIRPGETLGYGGATGLETALDTAQWLMASADAARLDGSPLPTVGRTWADGNRVPLLSEKFEKELRSMFRSLLLARVDSKTPYGQWMNEQCIAIAGTRSVPIRRFVKPADDEIRENLRDVLSTKKGSLTAYSWNPMHPHAREIFNVRLGIFPDGFAYHVDYRIPDDGSSWTRVFDDSGERAALRYHGRGRRSSIRAFVRRWPFAKILNAPIPAEDFDTYLPWMRSGMDPAYTASRWRNYGESGPAWVGFDSTTKPPTIVCSRCGAADQHPMPAPFPATAAHIARFDEAHRRCPARSTT